MAAAYPSSAAASTVMGFDAAFILGILMGFLPLAAGSRHARACCAQSPRGRPSQHHDHANCRDPSSMAHSEIVKGTVKAFGPASGSGHRRRYAWLELVARGGTVTLRNVDVGPNVSGHLTIGTAGAFLVQRGARRCAIAALKTGASYAEDRNLLLLEGLVIAIGVGALGLPLALATWAVFRTGEVTGVPLVLAGLAAVLVFSRFGPLSEGDYAEFRKQA